MKNGSPPYGFPTKTARGYRKVLHERVVAHGGDTDPNAVYSATYGDEFKLMGRPLGLIASGTFGRSFDDRKETQRLFASGGDTTYSYDVNRPPIRPSSGRSPGSATGSRPRTRSTCAAMF